MTSPRENGKEAANDIKSMPIETQSALALSPLVGILLSCLGEITLAVTYETGKACQFSAIQQPLCMVVSARKFVFICGLPLDSDPSVGGRSIASLTRTADFDTITQRCCTSRFRSVAHARADPKIETNLGVLGSLPGSR